jgi:hypothetical protein
MIVVASSPAFAQKSVTVTGRVAQGQGVAVLSGKGAPVIGAPYSATVTNESIQILADGTRIVHSSTGTTARDSQGRTRQEAALPALGNLSAANLPRLIFIQDPVAQVFYTLNMTDQTAQKMPAPPTGGGAGTGVNAFFTTGASIAGQLPPPPLAISKMQIVNDQGPVVSEDLGAQVVEGLIVQGIRTTRTIPAGQIGNDRPLNIVIEVWTSPDLGTIVSSKRSDPRIGEQTFQLTNITRAEPDSSLFTVPAGFTITDGPPKIIYRLKH